MNENGRKSPVHVTDDMRRKVAAEYRDAPRRDRAAVAEKYNLAMGTIAHWVQRGYANGAAPAQKVVGKTSDPKAERPLTELLSIVVTHAARDKIITGPEALALLGLAFS